MLRRTLTAQSNTWLNDLDKEFQHQRELRRFALRGKELIDNGYGFEKHFIRGQAKMKTRIGLALALGHVKAGRIEQMRSLVRPIRRAA